MLWLGSLLVLPGAARGQTPSPAPFDVAHLPAPAPLYSHMDVLRDPTRQLTLADVTNPEMAARFVPAGAEEPNFGLSTDALWGRFTLTNSGSEPQAAVVRLDLPSASDVDFYAPAATRDAPQTINTGARLPFASRALPDHDFAFPVTLAPGETQSFYVRVVTDFALRLPLAIWPAAVYRAAIGQETVAWAIVVGLVLLLSVYNLLVFLVVRDRDHLFLGLAGAISILTTALVNGFAAPWLGNQATHFTQLAVVMVALSALAYIALVISFLDLRHRVRWAFYLLVAVAVGAAGAAVIGLVVSPGLGLALLLAGTPILLIVTLVATVIGVRQGYRPAAYFLAAQITPIVLGLLQSTAILGLAPWTPPFVTSVPTSELLLVVLMSLALADRVNTARREVESANRALAASEQRLADYLDALPFNVQVHDNALRPIYVNAAIHQAQRGADPALLALDYMAALAAMPVFVAGTGEPYPVERLPLLRAARGEKAHADDLAIRRDGVETPLEAWSVPLRDAGGAVAAIITAFQDISQRRAIEQELAGYRDQLEARVAQRTAELAAVNASLGARVAELSAISDISRHMALITDPDLALQKVVKILVELYDVPNASISLLDAERGALRVVAMEARGNGGLLAYLGRTLPYLPGDAPDYPRQGPVVIAELDHLPYLPAAMRAELRTLGVAQVLIAPLLARDEALGVISLVTDDPARRFSPDDLRVAQTVAGQVAAAIDVGRLIAETRRQRDVADALRQTTSALSHSLEHETVLATILQQMHHVLDYEGAAIALAVDDQLVIVGAEGLSERHLGLRVPMTGGTPLQAVFQGGELLLLQDTQQWPDWWPWSGAEALRSWLGVPLVTGGKVIGVLYVVSMAVGTFARPQAELLMTFADQAAIAVTNARLHQQAQVTAAVSERERIARDLHDAVTQTIFSASLIADSLTVQLPEASPAVAANLATLVTLTKSALAELRALLLELRPEHLTATPLDRLLTQLAEAFTGRMGTPVQVTANCDPHYKPLPAVQIAVYRIAQEALNNVARHAHAQHVTINLVLRPGAIRLGVLDDGRGFDVPARSRARLGIAILHERAAEIGARLTIDSAPGMGTQVFLFWNEAEA